MVRFRNFTVFKEAGSQFPISTIHTCKTQAPAERQPATIVSNVLNRVRMAFPFDTVYQMTGTNTHHLFLPSSGRHMKEPRNAFLKGTSCSYFK